MGKGTITIRHVTLNHQGRQTLDAEVIEEQSLTIYVNGSELATLMSTPVHQDALALGFLLNEGIITAPKDVSAIHLCAEGTCVDIWLNVGHFERPQRFVLTSGCGGGITFDDLDQRLPPLDCDDLLISPQQLRTLMDQLYRAAVLYNRARGVHASALSDGEQLLLVAEDVGRHNTLDKLRGLAIQQGIDTRGRIILTTGRVSSEMLNKARRMKIPLVCSRTSPTSLSIQLARFWRITLVGYLRRNSLNVYTHPERLILSKGTMTQCPTS